MSSCEKPAARARILQAATQVFSEMGVKGATTREIARVAEVNETTLFRLFQNKEGLLKAVAEECAIVMSEELSGPGMAQGDLYLDLLHYATVSEKMLTQNEAMIRTFVSESSRQPAESKTILTNAWKPVKLRLREMLIQAQHDGKIHPDRDPRKIVELLTGIIFAHVMRRGLDDVPYNTQEYLEGAIQILLRGISPEAHESTETTLPATGDSDS